MALTENSVKQSIVLPLSIIENFFTCHSLHESKIALKEIQEQLFNKSYPYEQGSVAHDNTLYFFEKLEELIDAAYLLNQK
jgi:hypothetical protein